MSVAGLIGLGKLFSVVYVLTVVLYSLYLSYCTLRVMKNSGRLSQMPWVLRVHCWGILGFALALDVVFNVVVGTMIFLEAPELRRLTFTARCKKHMTSSGYRGRFARWVCDGWLNPAEPGHC